MYSTQNTNWGDQRIIDALSEALAHRLETLGVSAQHYDDCAKQEEQTMLGEAQLRAYGAPYGIDGELIDSLDELQPGQSAELRTVDRRLARWDCYQDGTVGRVID
jgi:hypothetical protein